MDKCFQKGFVLLEVLLSAFLSVGLLLLTLRFWRHWSTEVRSILYRLHVIQSASLLPHVLEARWRRVGCRKNYSRIAWLTPQEYYHQWSQGVFPRSNVLMHTKCGSDQFYFLADAKDGQGMTLYEKVLAHPAQALIKNLLYFTCQPSAQEKRYDLSCVYGFPWPNASGRMGKKEFRTRFKAGNE
mgnify:CR=1 FL=1